MDIPNLMYIDGQWTGASDGNTFQLLNPATEEEIGRIPIATREDIDHAIQAAAIGWERWKEVDAWTRSRILRETAQWIRDNFEFIAGVLTEEQGKPLAEARGEVGAAADQFDWYADEARRIYGRTIEGHDRSTKRVVLKQPIGPVAAFSPWNFPVLLTARKIAPALAAGCSVVAKPDLEAPRAALLLAKACEIAGLPAGVLNIVTGDPAQISSQLCNSPLIRKVSFTGSVPIGRLILKQCAETIKPVTLELGGHSPLIIFADADVEAVAEMAARFKYRNMGQVCISASRFFVQESIMPQFTRKFVEVTRKLRVGHGTEPGVDIGPLANKRRVEATEALIADAVSKGAKLELGGKRMGAYERGFFFEPTILTGVNPDMQIMTEEPFCPVAPVSAFVDAEDAIQKANATEYGLAAYVFTSDLRTATLMSEGLEAGMVGINATLLATAEAPFGGIKHSGFGREGGSEGIEEYLVEKLVTIRPFPEISPRLEN